MKYLFFGVFGMLLFILGWHEYVRSYSKPHLYDELDRIPSKKVGLLLGTSKYLENGRVNLYYKYRIAAATQLYKAGKLQYLLVSGDNSRKEYDEPTQMQQDLIKKGVPAERIYLDYAGFRTYDSVLRAQKVFGQRQFIVISQPFHNERAVFIARQKGIAAIGYSARAVSTRYGLKIQIRERLARVKMLLDLVFGKQPKYLGEAIQIGEE